MFSHICWNISEQANSTLYLSVLETKSLNAKFLNSVRILPDEILL